MNTTIDQQAVDRLLSDFMVNKKGEVVKLLTLNGVFIPEQMPGKNIDIAFLKAIMDNNAFRKQLADVLANDQHHNFVDNAAYINYVDPDQPWLGDQPSSSTTSTTATTPKKTSFLGSIFTPDLIKEGIKTGLDTVSTNAATKANATNQQNALELERIRLQQIQAQNEGSKLNPQNMSAGTKLAIGVGLAAVTGIIIYLVMKAKKKG